MPRPVNIYFATHKTCNLACNYCYLNDQFKKARKADDDEVLNSLKMLINKIEDEDYQIGTFCFHGAEPTLLTSGSLAAATNQVVEHKLKNNLKPFVSIQSNGKNFTEDYLLNLKKLLIHPESLKLGFSIDPPKAVHDHLRNNTYDEVVDNYKFAKSLNFPVSVLTVITKNTINHLDEFGNWIKNELYSSKKTGNPYKVKAKIATGELAPDMHEIEKLSDFLIENKLYSMLQSLSYGYCLQAGNECEWYEFDIDGNCYSCNKNYNDKGIFANWKNEKLADIIVKRKKIFSDNFENAECHICPYEMICNSGCPADRIKVGPNKGKSHECYLIKNILDSELNKGISLSKLIDEN